MNEDVATKCGNDVPKQRLMTLGRKCQTRGLVQVTTKMAERMCRPVKSVTRPGLPPSHRLINQTRALFLFSLSLPHADEQNVPPSER